MAAKEYRIHVFLSVRWLIQILWNRCETLQQRLTSFPASQAILTRRMSILCHWWQLIHREMCQIDWTVSSEI